MNFSFIRKLFSTRPVLAASVAAGGLIALAAVSSITVSATHVTINPNLSVSPPIISFSTVFPGEVLFKPFIVDLSDAFIEEPSLDDVEYRIVQKPKPRIDSDAERAYCQANPTDYTRCYRSLCPYLSKEADLTPPNDTSIPAFHDPNAESSIVYGRLAKSDNDVSDTWTIDLHVPCFNGQCGQTASVPPQYQLDPSLNGEVFGCDLVVEVLKVSFNETCPTCDGTTITVDQNVTVDFNPSTPVCNGDPDLCAFATYTKSGATPDTWKVTFDLGGKKLLVKNGATISTAQVGIGNNKYSPGLEIRTDCTVDVEQGGHIVVQSLNKQAGDLTVHADGTITVNGEVKNEVTGTNGLPGEIKLDSTCGDIVEGQSGLIQDLGVDPGGNDIYLFTHDRGNIIVNGLVLARAHAHLGDLTLNRPNIHVAAFNGAVTINGNSTEPLYDEYNYSGTKYDLWGGLLSWVRANVNPGNVEVQAKHDITVNGHGDDPTAPARKSFGAVAAIATMSDAPGGRVDVRSLEGSIIGTNRAFDVSGRNRLATNFAKIRLWAADNILLSRPGANASFNPVVDASSPSVGDKGGANELRAYAGNIQNTLNALISAVVPLGSGSVQGTNALTACTGVSSSGGATVTPADSTGAGDDNGTCAPGAPPQLIFP